MKHLINPLVDCVFKAILGAIGQEPLLVHFINAVLRLEVPIKEVAIENPYNDKQKLDDKLTIVDIKARDECGHVYQVELQLTSPNYLVSRMIHNLIQIHDRQVKQGESFAKAKRSIAIWLCERDVRFLSDNSTKETFQYKFLLHDPINDATLADDIELNVVLIHRWIKPALTKFTALDYWLYFFTEAKNWSKLPEEDLIDEIKRAMKVLEQFSEKEKSYYEYMRREQIRLEKASIEDERKMELAALEQEQQRRLQAQEQTRQAQEESRQAQEESRQAQEESRQAQEESRLIAKQLNQTVLNLFATNVMSIEQIAQVTQLNISQVQAIIDSQ